MRGEFSSAAHVSVILNEMIETTRQTGAHVIARDQPIRCPSGTYVLRGMTSFRVVKPGQRSVWACDLQRIDAPEDLGPVVIKTVLRQEIDDAVRGPPREAKFYATLAARASTKELRIPRPYAANILADRSIQLFMELFDGLREISTLAELCRAATALGCFAGHCHAAGLHKSEWLPSGTLMPQFHYMVAFEKLLAFLPVGAGERDDILENYSRLLDRIADVNAAYAGELPTLCNGDVNRRNLVAYGQNFAAIDWETAQAGRLGDDLGRLALRLLREPEGEEADEPLIAAYSAGAAPFFSRDPSASVRRVYRLRLIFESMGEIDRHWRWARNAPDKSERRQRMGILARSYRSMSARAREAMHELDGR